MGCFHSLQPRSDPFGSPCIPALLPSGFVRWQTLQLLLSPEEHVAFMQEAVKWYDVPTADGGVFPKVIPRESFPEKPDVEMVRWHASVTGSLEQDHHTRRLKYSPFQSPRDPPERGEGYFLNGRPAHQRRSSRTPRSSSHEHDPTRMLDSKRRASVPDLPSPQPSGPEPQHRTVVSTQYPPPPPPGKQLRNFPHSSPHRMSNGSSQHRTPDVSQRHRYSPFTHRTSQSSASYRPHLSSSAESNGQKAFPAHAHHNHATSGGKPRRPRSPSTIDESTSGSEASSEDSQPGRGRHAHDSRRRNSLFPPNIFRHHHRRHSHDSAYAPGGLVAPPLPPRPTSNRHPPTSMNGIPPSTYTPIPTSPHVAFKPVDFDDSAANSAPESPGGSFSPTKTAPQMRYYDPNGQPNLHQELIRNRSGSDLSRENSRSGQRKAGVPLRVSTVTGVGGRKYAAAEPGSASRRSPPKQVGMVGVGNGRRG